MLTESSHKPQPHVYTIGMLKKPIKKKSAHASTRQVSHILHCFVGLWYRKQVQTDCTSCHKIWDLRALKLLTYSPLHPVWSHRDITCDITIQSVGYRWLPIGATSVHKTVLIDAVHSGTVHSGTVCCAGRDPYLNVTVHLVSGVSMSTCIPPPPASSCHSKPATQSWPQPRC